MPKQKTHKATSKVLNPRPGGTVARGCSGGRHNTGKKNMDSNRKTRKGATLSSGDRKRLRSLI